MKKLPDSPLLNVALQQFDADILYKQHPDTPRSSDAGCPTCGKNRGFGKNGTIIVNGEEWECNCQDQLQRHKHYLSAGIGIKYQRLSWDDWMNPDFDVAALSPYRTHIDDFIREGVGLVLSGTSGTGKTMLCTLILKDLVQKGYRCYMTTASQLITMVRDGWKSQDERTMFRQKIERAEVLFIDDPGKELFGINPDTFNNSHSKMTIENILRERVQSSRPTFLTTNLNEHQVEFSYGRAFASLLSESSFLITVGGQDHRKTVKSSAHDRVFAGERRAIH